MTSSWLLRRQGVGLARDFGELIVDVVAGGSGVTGRVRYRQ